MQLETINLADLPIIYGIHGKFLTMPTEPAYIGSMLGVLQPGEATRYHAHHDNEQFIILEGNGWMESNNNRVAVSTGDIIYLSPGDKHSLTNIDKNKHLSFLSLWWAYAHGAVIPKMENTSTQTKKAIIIAPPPTPNGDLHLGHLAGPYLGADILKRFLLQNGTVAHYLTGSDDHQSYVALKAKQTQTTPEEISSQFAKNIQAVFANLSATPELFYRPLHNEHYIAFVKAFFIDLFQSSAIKLKEVIQPYCEHCHHWLFEAHISGLCPHCHSACGGNSCETCGLPNACTDLINPVCKYCRNSPNLLQTQQVYLALQDQAKALRIYLDQLPLPSHIRLLVRKLLANELPEIAVTHFSDWGIPAPFNGLEGQKLSTWCEMAPGYLFATSLLLGARSNEMSAEWQKYWNDLDTKIILFFGFDNTFFYILLLPALLLACGANIRLPDEIIYNEFYLFEESKFSTSRSHAIWAKDILKHVSSDYLRYYLAATRPESERTRFSYASFVELINKDLVDNLSEWLSSLANRVAVDFDGICPDGGEWNIEHDEFIQYLQLFLKQYSTALNSTHFSPVTAIRLLQELVIRAKKLAVSTVFLQGDHKTNRLEYQTSTVIELTAAKYYAIASASIMPQYAIQLAKALNLDQKFPWEINVRLLPKGTRINGLANCIFKRLAVEQLINETVSNDNL